MTDSLHPMPKCCIAYTTDRKYLFPTLVSAVQARRHSSRSKADVIIFCIGLDPAVEQVFLPACQQEGIGLVSVDSSLVEGQTAMLARLFLNRYVPAQYTQYLYLDSDVHILDSIDGLIDAEVPAGHFLAANDPFTFLLEDKGVQSRDLGRHMQSLGLSEEQALRYFNSGVLRISRQGWDEIGQRAWKYCQSKPGAHRFVDQDALNVVANEQRLPLSLAWNYPVFLRNSRVESYIAPRIKHFMSHPKPWHGAFPPWTPEDCEPYADTVRRYPMLEPYVLKMVLRDRVVYHLQQRGKKIHEFITWGLSRRRARILRYEESCSFAPFSPVKAS